MRPYITINPEHPSSDDAVELVFHLYCPMHTTSRKVVNSQFIITVETSGPPCIGEDPPIPVPWSVGRLESGEYQAVITSSSEVLEVQAFSVSEGELPFPTPQIPTLGVSGAILLTTALVWIANKALRRTHKRTS